MVDNLQITLPLLVVSLKLVVMRRKRTGTARELCSMMTKNLPSDVSLLQQSRAWVCHAFTCNLRLARFLPESSVIHRENDGGGLGGLEDGAGKRRDDGTSTVGT